MKHWIFIVAEMYKERILFSMRTVGKNLSKNIWLPEVIKSTKRMTTDIKVVATKLLRLLQTYIMAEADIFFVRITI